MKTKILLSSLFAVAAWSLCSLAMADWQTGPCSGSGSAPCIEAEVSGNTFHFNGNGGHSDEWHGLPTTGTDFEFSGPLGWSCNGLEFDCNLTLAGKVKKCQDSNGAWRIGIQVNSSNVSGAFVCGTMVLGGFPWYAANAAPANHCPFTDECDSFVPYDPSASTLTFDIGNIDMNVFMIPRVTDGHLHGMVFTPGVGANLDFSSAIFDCSEADQDCYFNGFLTLNNATSLDIH